MLAGARIDTISGRQHLTAPHSYASELTAAGTFLEHVLPARGQLLECGIFQDQPTPVYIDSASAIFVIHDRAAVKRSIWLLRRATILQESAEYGDIIAIKIPGVDNFSDPETKQVSSKVWRRHLWYANNLPGPCPE
jgi:hypothetical protein